LRPARRLTHTIGHWTDDSSSATLARGPHDAASDGNLFLMNVPVGTETIAPITVILNWQAALKNASPTS
jgi:hypothetical protein